MMIVSIVRDTSGTHIKNHTMRAISRVFLGNNPQRESSPISDHGNYDDYDDETDLAIQAKCKTRVVAPRHRWKK